MLYIRYRLAAARQAGIDYLKCYSVVYTVDSEDRRLHTHGMQKPGLDVCSPLGEPASS